MVIRDLHLLFLSPKPRLVEEADFKSTRDLFGGKADEKNLYNFIPKSENDFLEYAELISHRLRPYEVCKVLPAFVVSLIKSGGKFDLAFINF